MPSFNSWTPSEASLKVTFKGSNIRLGYLPTTYRNGDYVLGSRCFSIRDIKYGGSKSAHNPSRWERLLQKRRGWLQTNYGLSRKSAEVFLRRPPSQARRIEDTIHGIIDTLLLFDSTMFQRDRVDCHKALLLIVRKTLTTATYSVGQVMKLWKEFCSFLYNRFAGLSPELPKPGGENFFYRALRSHPDIIRMINGEVGKALSEKFAHLTSTRHFASGDRKAEESSMKKFFSTIEEPFETDDAQLTSIQLNAERVGEKCRALAGGIQQGMPHISLSSAGSFYATVKDGGAGLEIRQALHDVVNVRVEEDEIISTPFGPLKCPKGCFRWRYWCRENPYDHYPDVSFGDVIMEERFKDQHPYYQGFDEAIGNQILVTAYIKFREWELTGLAVPCRVLTVPEPGNKARIVTTGPFWLKVLQQAVSHTLKDILKHHPSARSSLMKTDQAWQALYLFQDKQFPEGSAVLSSDLSEATDCIPKEVGLRLLQGFCKGCGIRSNLLNVCFRLLRSDRCFTAPGFVSETQTRGIMMGEPLTKCVLTIQGLTMEESAMRTYLSVPITTRFFKSPSWRSFHVGGDDHLAAGPRPYLSLITKAFVASGARISEGKHGVSNRVVKYCEKVLEVPQIIQGFSVSRINDSTEGYEDSPFVDSVKIRLLSPLTKAFEVSSERNIAIGKGLSLGRTLKWMNVDHFPRKWLRMVRDRFMQRMGSLLPDRSSAVYWQLMLPVQWGGLDLYLPDEVEALYNLVPTLTKGIMERVQMDEPEGFEHLKLLRKFLSNYSYRGYRLSETDVGLMNDHVEQVVRTSFPRATWREIKSEFDPKGIHSAKTIADSAWQQGWKGEEDIIDELMRPILFKEILLGVERASAFNTEPLKRRYAKLWDTVYRGPDTLSLVDFKKLVPTRPPAFFYKVGYPEEFQFASDRGYIYKSALDDALHGMPILKTGFPFC
jgi:hypothetical protein